MSNIGTGSEKLAQMGLHNLLIHNQVFYILKSLSRVPSLAIAFCSLIFQISVVPALWANVSAEVVHKWWFTWQSCIKENTCALRPALIYHQTKLGNFLNFLPHNNANGNNFAKLFPQKVLKRLISKILPIRQYKRKYIYIFICVCSKNTFRDVGRIAL